MRKLACFALVLVIMTAVLASCSDQPEYMNPYGEGVDPDTVTTIPFQTRPVEETYSTIKTAKTTKPSLAEIPDVSELVIPEGYKICPLCQGIKVYCEHCLGSAQLKAEVIDEDSGIFVRKYIDCSFCAKDPGFTMCEVCENVLYIEE